MPLRPASSSASASRATIRVSSGWPRSPICSPAVVTINLAPTLGPSTTVARETGSLARMWSRSTSYIDVMGLATSPVERLDEQSDGAATCQTDGERLVVAVSERDDPRFRLAMKDGQCLADDSALDAASADRAGDLAVTVDGHCGTRLAGGRPFDVDHSGDGHVLAGRTPAVDFVQQLTHQDLLAETPEITLASSSIAASE